MSPTKNPVNHHQHKYENIKFSVVIVSDTRYQQLKTKKTVEDLTTPLIKKILTENNYILQNQYIVPNDKNEIAQILLSIIETNDSAFILFSGGTGIGPKDITIETLQPLLEKEMPGFGELFRHLSYEEIGPGAMLSRATAGIIKKKIIFILPGNPNAVETALKKLILPQVDHLINMIGI
ncbi:MAG: molybdenum cofactor biosynthesis protein MoaB [Candidatus Helarchaeota archaeon]|nr:molybdenum cofactor biosynthesis protein MoaB [Candidatus Helarchaeota archaeon]